MSLLTRYLLRQLTAPLLFALGAATGVLLLNQVARRFSDLVGKGLDPGVIAEVFALSLPFIIAMTLPMAVLVAVLYTFSHLAADNEITALRASGVSVGRLLAPVLAWGLAFGVVTFLFVDLVLPRTNARLKNLWIDILRKKPTFELREQVINPIPNSPYSLRASRLDPNSGRLMSVTIFDQASQNGRRIIHADSGQMGFAPNGRDLSLTLWSGTSTLLKNGEPAKLEMTEFRETVLRVPEVLDKLERTQDLRSTRGEREMGTCEMLAVVDSARHDAASSRFERRQWAERDLRLLLGLEPPSPAKLPRRRLAPAGYCAVAGPAADSTRPEIAYPLGDLPTTAADLEGATARERDALRRANAFAVEVQKKWALGAACLAFVFVGLPLAIRFPRGGIGLVIGFGMLAYALYNLGLTIGEASGDRGLLPPVVAMWLPNLLFVAIGALALWSVSREFGSTRGGDLDELIENLRAVVPFLRRRDA
ncbi:MAG: LptF/LptG family permease [Gemmatimonadales bacterium]|nr:LptF/LptG family permease [Gemmatimonadales bacterium]